MEEGYEEPEEEKQEEINAGILSSKLKEIKLRTDSRYNELKSFIDIIILEIRGNPDRKGYEDGISGDIERTSRRAGISNLDITRYARTVLEKCLAIDDYYTRIIKILADSDSQKEKILLSAKRYIIDKEDEIIRLKKEFEELKEKYKKKEEDEPKQILTKERESDLKELYDTCKTQQQYISLLNPKLGGLRFMERMFLMTLDDKYKRFKAVSEKPSLSNIIINEEPKETQSTKTDESNLNTQKEGKSFFE